MGKVLREEACAWPSGWVWHPTDTLSSKVSPADAEWLAAWLPRRRAAADDGEVCFLQYTSGSTGQPKGVMVGTRNLLCNIHAMKQASDRTVTAMPGEKICMVSWLPQYHDMGLIGGCLSSAVAGWRSDLMSPHAFLAKPAAWLQAISRLSPTHAAISVAPNFGYALALRRVPPAALTKLSLGHWMLAMNGAEPIRPATLRDFAARFGACGFDPAAWACLYGLAETCLYACGKSELVVPLFVSRDRLGAGDAAMPVQSTAGKSGWKAEDWLECPGVYVHSPGQTGQTIRIAHPDSGQLMADGRVGEVRLAGGSVALGYWQLDDLSASTFGQALRPADQAAEHAEAAVGPVEPAESAGQAAAADEDWSCVAGCAFLRTGDLGFLWHGRLYLVGRIKDVICLKGRTLHAHDVEALAEQTCTSLRPGCCAAFPLLAPDGSESLGLMAEVRPEARTDGAGLEALVADINRGLAAEGVRASAVTLLRPRSILKTTSGKLRRRDCRAAHEEIGAALRLTCPSKALGGSAHGAAAKTSATGPGGRIPLDAVLHYWCELPAAAAPQPGPPGNISPSSSDASLATTRNRSQNDLPSGGTSPSASPFPPSSGEPAEGGTTRRPSPQPQPDWRSPSPVPTHYANGRQLSKIETLAAESNALFNRVVVVERFHRAGTSEAHTRLPVVRALAANQTSSSGTEFFPIGGSSWSNPTNSKAPAGGLARRRAWLAERSLGHWVKLALVAAVITAIVLK